MCIHRCTKSQACPTPKYRPQPHPRHRASAARLRKTTAGIVRLEATTGVDAEGTKYAMTLIFQRAADSGTTELGITQSGVGGPPPNPGEDPVPIPGVPWALGTISVLIL